MHQKVRVLRECSLLYLGFHNLVLSHLGGYSLRTKASRVERVNLDTTWTHMSSSSSYNVITTWWTHYKRVCNSLLHLWDLILIQKIVFNFLFFACTFD